MKWFSLPTVLIVLASSAPANAGLFDRLEDILSQDSALNAPAEIDSEPSSSDMLPPPEVDSGFGTGPMMQGKYMSGYPFAGGCCETKSSCCDDLWHGYCGKRACGSRILEWFDHCARWKGCGLGRAVFKHHGGPSCDDCSPKGGHGWGLKWHPHMRRHAHACRRACDPNGHHRLGLFDWLHHHKGHGCGKCGLDYGHCGCGAHSKMMYGGSTMMYGGSKIIGEGHPVVTPHAVPAPTPIPAPAPGNSARLRLMPRSLFQPANLEY